MSDDHKRGRSKDSFATAAKEAVKNYERWCEDHGEHAETDVAVELRVTIDPTSSLSEYIAVLKVHD